MAKHIEITMIDGETGIHIDDETGGHGYTLCGMDALGDGDLYKIDPKEVKGKADCVQCIRTIEFCKLIRKSEYTATTEDKDQ